MKRVLIGVLLALLACAGARAQINGASFIIPVNNSKTGVAVPGATVTLTQGLTQVAQATSDANGNAQFTNTPQGTYTVTIVGPGLSPISYTLTVTGPGGNGNVLVTAASSMVLPVTTTPSATVVSDFFIVLNQNVNSVTISGSPNAGDEVVLTLAQDNVGGRTFTWPSNFLNTPGLLTGPGQVTAATFQYCGVAGTNAACPANSWQATDVSPNSPGAGACFGGGCIIPAQFGVVADGIEYTDATWNTGVNNNVSITATDVPLTAALNNKTCYGIPSGGGHLANVGTFTFTNATNGVCTGLLNSASGNGRLRILTNDTTGWVNTMAACFARQSGCTIIMPAGNTGIQQCLNTSSTLPVTNFFITLLAQGSTGNGSTFWPMPGFTFSPTASTVTVNGNPINIGSSTAGCFPTRGPGVYDKFSIDGGGENMNGVDNRFNPLLVIGNGSLANVINLYNFDTLGTNFNTSGTVQFNGNFAYGTGFFLTSFGDGEIKFASNTACYNCGTGTGTVHITSGSLTDYFGSYSALSIDQGNFHGFGTTVNGGVGQSFGTVADCTSCSVLNSGSAGNVAWNFPNFRSGGQPTVTLRNSTIAGGSTGGAFASGTAGEGVVIDQGQNTITGALPPFTGKYVAPAGGSMAAQTVSAATNFGANLGAQTVVPATGPIGNSNLKLLIGARQVTAGASCGAGSNTVFATISYTAPGGTVTTQATTTLTISANGAVDSGAAAEQVLDLPIKQGTSVTYTTTSVLASAGCSPVPQYVIDAAVN